MSIQVGYSPRIAQINLYLAGDADIYQSQVVKVKTHESFQSGERPVPSGLYDPRMGAIASYYACSTCGYDEKQCPGHFGYYELSHYIAQPVVIEDFIKWLKVVCLKCGTLLVDVNKLKNIPMSRRLQTAAQMQLADKICHVCDTIHPKIKVYDDNLFNFISETTTEKRILKIPDIHAIFQKISDETCVLMGRSVNSHPRKYYTKYLPIPPISMRPYYKNVLTNKSHRTSPTLDFIKNLIRKNSTKGNQENMEKIRLFLNRCNYDMIRGGSQKKGEVRTSNVIGGPLSDAIMKMLGGKKGLIRNFQMAHRALSGSRITISGNPTLEIDEVGIPLFVVKTLQVSEIVREWNIDRLKVDVISGHCSRIKRISTGTEHGINEYNKNDIILDYGDMVYRHIHRGDMCIFNRPPSLKESAIGSHRAVPFTTETENTFQTNVAVCVNYNADYDGDQMRLKVLRTLRAITESKYISSISRMMLSSQRSYLVNGQVQDSVTGSALMTRNNVLFDKLHAMRTWAKTGLPPPVFDKKEYTGREIISFLLKSTPITYRGRAKFYNEAYKDYIPYKDDEINVVIKNGVVEQGILDSASIGHSSTNGVFHIMALEYGTKITLKKVFSYQQIVLKFLEMKGFTMGMDDLIIPKHARDEIKRIVNDQEMKSKVFAEELSRGEIYPPMGISLMDYYEQQQLRRLSNDGRVFGPIITNIDQEKNGLFQMIMYGGKGKPSNMMNIFGYVGQLQVEGERMPPTFSPYRSSVYFPRYAMSPASKGFVKQSLSEGLDPQMMSYAGAEARQQIVQKSQSTAISGSNQRKHIKNMENTLVGNFRHVYKSQMIIQYIYGDNGFDPRNLVKVKLQFLNMTVPAIKDKYLYISSNKSFQDIFDEEYQSIIDDYNTYHQMAYNLESVGLVNGFPDKLLYGAYIESSVENILISKPKNISALVEMVKYIKEFIHNLPYLYINEYNLSVQGYVPPYLTSICFTMGMLLRISFHSKNVLTKTNMDLLKIALDNIKFKLLQNLISAGTCVGIIAAQSVGEPMTQMMLDAVHGGSSGASAGLEKSKEILSAKFPSNKTNSMWIRLLPEISKDKLQINNVAEILKGVKMEDFIDSYQVFLESYGKPIFPLYKHEENVIKNFEKKNPLIKTISSRLSKWVIRLEMNALRMMYKSITTERLVESLYKNFSNFVIVYTTELDDEVIIRIYIKESEFVRESAILTYVTNNLVNKIKSTLIRGVHNILDTKVQPITIRRKDDLGSYIPTEEFMIRTVGVDIKNIIIIAPSLKIDTTQLHIGSVMDTFEYYGIEAARARIIEQMVLVMEGSSPTYHHLSIYADILTWSGKIKAIERAVRSERSKVLPMASGYSAGKTLMTAAAIGTMEDTHNITAPVMLGTIPQVGTHYSNILINEEFVIKNTQTVLDVLKNYK